MICGGSTKDRIKLLKISQGSIVMQFEVTANRTASEISAVNIFGVLERKLADPKSDFRTKKRRLRLL